MHVDIFNMFVNENFQKVFLNCIKSDMYCVDFIEIFNISFFLWAPSLKFKILA
jgi:hypothetical protein